MLIYIASNNFFSYYCTTTNRSTCNIKQYIR